MLSYARIKNIDNKHMETAKCPENIKKFKKYQERIPIVYYFSSGLCHIYAHS